MFLDWVNKSYYAKITSIKIEEKDANDSTYRKTKCR